MAAFAQPHFTKAGLSDRIHVMLGPALESMGKLAEAGRSFDLAFLDADKPGYIHYYNALMDKGLLAPGGCIVVDNSLMKVRGGCVLKSRFFGCSWSSVAGYRF